MTAVKYIGGIIRGTAAERGSYTTTNLNAGWIWIETDTNPPTIYFWTGSAWRLLASGAVTDFSGTLAIGHGGTGQTTATAAFDALSPMTTAGDIITGGTSGTRTRLGLGTSNQALKVNSGGTALDYGTLPVAGGGTGATTLTGVLKGNGTSAVTAAAQLAVADGGTGVGTLTGVVSGNGTSAFTASNTLSGVTVDGASNTVKVPMVFGGGRVTAAAGTVYSSLYAAPNTVNTNSSTETNVSLPLNFTFAPTKISVKLVATNTSNGNVIVSFRDDAADVTGSPVTIASTDTTAGTLKESTVSGVIASGSLVCWKIDASAASSGTTTMTYIIQGYIY